MPAITAIEAGFGNVYVKIFSEDGLSQYQSGTSLSACSGVSSANYAVGVVTAEEAATSDGDGLAAYGFDWPTIDDGLYLLRVYATNNPTPATEPLAAGPMRKGGVVLATDQPDYAPAKAGDQMTLHSDYDAAKTAAQAGDAMTLEDGAITAAKIASSALDNKGNWNVGKTGYTLSQTFPSNFAALGINSSGHIQRVVLVDTTTTNTDMRGTDNAVTSLSGIATSSDLSSLQSHGDSNWATATGFSTHSAADVWSNETRTLTAGTNIVLPSNGLSNVTAWTVDITGSLSGTIGGLSTQAKADVNEQVDAAIETYSLQYVFASAYDPSSKPGNAAGLLNVLVENDGGVPRFTANALEQGPSGGGSGTSPVELVSTTIDAVTSQTVFTLSDGSADDDAYNGALVVITDQSAASQKSVGIVADYAGATKTVTLAKAPVFTVVSGDGVAVVADASVTAANSVTISPVVSMVMPSGELVSQPIEAKQKAAFVGTFNLLDGSLQPIDRTGHAFKLVVYRLDQETTEFEIAGLEAGGVNGNQVPFIVPSARTQIAGSYLYRLFDVEDPSEPLAYAENSFGVSKGVGP